MNKNIVILGSSVLVAGILIFLATKSYNSQKSDKINQKQANEIAKKILSLYQRSMMAMADMKKVYLNQANLYESELEINGFTYENGQAIKNN